MEKIIFEIRRVPDFPKDYGEMYPVVKFSRDVWDLVIQKTPKDKKYLDHFIIEDWIPYDKTPPITKEECGLNLCGGAFASNIPRGEKIVYLEIIVEDK